MAKAKGSGRELKEGFVLDNSIVMAWSFEDETEGYADAMLDRLAIARAVVPALWPLEVANALLMGKRRKRIGAGWPWSQMHRTKPEFGSRISSKATK